MLHVHMYIICNEYDEAAAATATEIWTWATLNNGEQSGTHCYYPTVHYSCWICWMYAAYNIQRVSYEKHICEMKKIKYCNIDDVN